MNKIPKPKFEVGDVVVFKEFISTVKLIEIAETGTPTYHLDGIARGVEGFEIQHYVPFISGMIRRGVEGEVIEGLLNLYRQLEKESSNPVTPLDALANELYSDMVMDLEYIERCIKRRPVSLSVYERMCERIVSINRINEG